VRIERGRPEIGGSGQAGAFFLKSSQASIKLFGKALACPEQTASIHSSKFPVELNEPEYSDSSIPLIGELTLPSARGKLFADEFKTQGVKSRAV
jgi:hypothetical protein